jgi:hypothetical protein
MFRIGVVSTCLVFCLTLIADERPGIQSAVNLSIENTTNAFVDIYGVDANGNEKIIVKRLPASQAVRLDLQPGNLLRMKIGNEVLGDYQADENLTQQISLAELASWQLPVQITLVNDTKNSLDVYWKDSDGKEILFLDDLRPGQQLVQTCDPIDEWIVKSKGTVLATYIADNIPDQLVSLKELIQLYTNQVTVEFRNTESFPVNIYWRRIDGTEVLAAPDLPAKKKYVVSGSPSHLWIIRKSDGDDLLGGYMTTDIKKQVCDIRKVNTVCATGESLLASDDRVNVKQENKRDRSKRTNNEASSGAKPK